MYAGMDDAIAHVQETSMKHRNTIPSGHLNSHMYIGNVTRRYTPS